MGEERRGTPRLSVVGLGKLGSPMAAVFASKGFDVIGLDVHRPYVEALNAGLAPVDEPRLPELIRASRAGLRATDDYDEAIAATDVTFVIVPTPSGADHVFCNDFVVAAVRQIGGALRAKAGDHLVVITSTVMPGSTGGVIREALEESSGRVVGRTVGLCYSPEFIALGSVVRDLLHPDFVLIGECDARYGDWLEGIYRASTESAPDVYRMSFVDAETCKIAVNTFVTMKISFANVLAELCDRLEGADVDVVSAALGADSRIGGKYLRGGVAYGGPCFPRDNKAFAALARRLGARCDLAEATDRINDYQVQRLCGAVEAVSRAGARIAVLGLSYKVDTSVVEASQGVSLARALLDGGYEVLVADPVSSGSAAAAIGPDVRVASTLAEAVASADVVVITTPWPEVRTIPRSAFARPAGPLAVIDPWGVLQDGDFAGVARVILPGRGGSATPRALAHAGSSS